MGLSSPVKQKEQKKKKKKIKKKEGIYNEFVPASKKRLTSAHLATSGIPQTLSPRHPVNTVLKAMGFYQDVVTIECLPPVYLVSV